MCGIAGLLHLDGQGAPAGATVQAMLQALVHRGPDDAGVREDGPLAFGTRRLSIIDVEGGHQPLSNEDGSVWAIQNGEIYNYRELREELIARGHRLRTGSDTETLVHLYRDRGDALVESLNGMFAIAVWDAPRRRLLLARDRLGIKPLYWYSDGRRLLFASELKGLLASGLVPKDLDPAAVRDFAELSYVPAPRSILAGVRKVLPGQLLVAESGTVSERRYWLPPAPAPDRGPEGDQLRRFSELFRDAVALQMRSDVPYGAFLSGGIDSSAIVGTMASLSSEPVRTFSIGFSGAGLEAYDERAHARVAADAFHTRHEEFVVGPDAFDLLGDAARFFDEPFADPAFLPTLALSKLARASVKVVLTGDGGDELFAGYNRYRSELLARQAEKLPGFIRDGVLSPLLGFLARGGRGSVRDWAAVARKRLRQVALPPDQRYLSRFHRFSPALWERVRGERLRDAGPSPADAEYGSILAGAGACDFITRRTYLDVRTWLPDQMLTKVDRATMAHSLEARVPFLDHRLVELALSLPDEAKITILTLKRFLRLAFRELLPVSLLRRAKHGFRVPLDEWLRGPLRERAREALSPAALRVHGFFDPDGVARLLHEHESGACDRSSELFTLLVFQAWHDRWMA
jgi:asparagine synthase (glutamine-hydrolysing)